MSLEAKLIVTACVLAIVLPIAVVVVRCMLRGERFDKTPGTTPLMPPSPPSIDIGGGP